MITHAPYTFTFPLYAFRDSGNPNESSDRQGHRQQEISFVNKLTEPLGLKGRYVSIPGALGIPRRDVHVIFLIILAIAVSYHYCCFSLLDL